MKRIFSFLLAVILISASVIAASAASAELADTGKTVVTMDDWVYEKINNDEDWELDEYIGAGGEVRVPRGVGEMSVISLGDHCFANNTAVTSVITSSPLWIIGEYAFINCTSLSKIELNYALHTIGVGAFSGTSALKDINLEESIVTEIKPYTFLNSGIEEVTLPSTCKKLGQYAFGQCYELTKVVIPDSVTEIDDLAFERSDNVVIYCSYGSAAHRYAESKGIDYVLPDDMLQEHFAGCTLSLTDYIGVNFHMELSDEVLADPDAKMRFTVSDNITEVPVSDATEKLVGDTTYYIFKCSVCAKEMTAQIKAQMIGSTKVGKTYTYSVKKYADYILAHADSAAYTRSVPLVKAMLNYGAYSQLYFDKDNPGTLANDGMDYEDIVLGEVDSAALESDYNAAYTVNNVGFTFAGATLSLQSETTLSLFFTSDETLKFSCRHDQLGEMQIDVDNDGTYQIARIRGIKARYLGDNFVLTVKNPSQTESGSVTYSPMLYCAKVLNNDQNTDEYQNVAKALYWYHQAAVAYFG